MKEPNMNYKDFYKQKIYKIIILYTIIRMIKYVTGDATNPIDTIDTNESKVIIHVCNDISRWGKGFVLAV